MEGRWPVSVMCCVLNVSKAGYYKYINNLDKPKYINNLDKPDKDTVLSAAIMEISTLKTNASINQINKKKSPSHKRRSF